MAEDMRENTLLWDYLKAVPKDAQKPFKRPGGFNGTAIKPMWTYHRMTEVFGPCGTGWGIMEPKFEVLPAGEEMLVYCTVSVWYSPLKDPDDPDKIQFRSNLIGVGGDKVLSKTKHGLSTDDEAFKKAFTDAVTNALKTLGAGADIHMGVYDGKYQDKPAEPEREAVPTAFAQAYMKWARGQIEDMPTKDDLLTWWQGEADARRKNDLTQDDVDELKGAMLKRFPPEQKAA